MYEDHSSHDQVALGLSPHRLGHCQDRAAAVLFQVHPARLHPAPTLRPADPPRVPQDRLSRSGRNPPRLGRVAGRLGPEEGPRPLHPPESGLAAARKRGVDALLGPTVAEARSRRLIPAKPRAAIDATGYETRHVSRYFAWRSKRSNKRRRQRSWPKLTAVLETRSHLFLAAHVSHGPSQDSPQFRPTVRAACGRCPVDTLLGDGAFDAEHNHALARQRLGVRSTVFPLNRRNTGRKWPKTRYRRQMVRRFRRKPRRSKHRRVYGQRWQIESGFSRQKRLLGSALRARKWVNQKKEIQLRVLTHNLMLLAAA